MDDKNTNLILNSISSLKKYINEKFDLINTRLDSHDEKFDLINTRLDSHDKKFTSYDKNFTSINEKFTSIDENFRQIRNELQSLVNIVTRIEYTIGEKARNSFRIRNYSYGEN